MRSEARLARAAARGTQETGQQKTPEASVLPPWDLPAASVTSVSSGGTAAIQDAATGAKGRLLRPNPSSHL